MYATYYEILDPVSVYAHSFVVFHNYVMFFLILTVVIVIWLLKLGLQFFFYDKVLFLLKEGIWGLTKSEGASLNRAFLKTILLETMPSELAEGKHIEKEKSWLLLISLKYVFANLLLSIFWVKLVKGNRSGKFLSLNHEGSKKERLDILRTAFYKSDLFFLNYSLLNKRNIYYFFFCKLMFYSSAGIFNFLLNKALTFFALFKIILYSSVYFYYKRNFLIMTRNENLVKSFFKISSTDYQYLSSQYWVNLFFNKLLKKFILDLIFSISLSNLSTIEINSFYYNFSGVYDLNQIYRLFLLKRSFKLLKFVNFYKILYGIGGEQHKLLSFSRYFDFFKSYHKSKLANFLFSTSIFLFFRFFGFSSYSFLPTYHIRYYKFLVYKFYVYVFLNEFIRSDNQVLYNSGFKYDRVFWINVLKNTNITSNNDADSKWVNFFSLRKRLVLRRYYLSLYSLMFWRPESEFFINYSNTDLNSSHDTKVLSLINEDFDKSILKDLLFFQKKLIFDANNAELTESFGKSNRTVSLPFSIMYLKSKIAVLRNRILNFLFVGSNGLNFKEASSNIFLNFILRLPVVLSFVERINDIIYWLEDYFFIDFVEFANSKLSNKSKIDLEILKDYFFVTERQYAVRFLGVKIKRDYMEFKLFELASFIDPCVKNVNLNFSLSKAYNNSAFVGNFPFKRKVNRKWLSKFYFGGIKGVSFKSFFEKFMADDFYSILNNKSFNMGSKAELDAMIYKAYLKHKFFNKRFASLLMYLPVDTHKVTINNSVEHIEGEDSLYDSLWGYWRLKYRFFDKLFFNGQKEHNVFINSFLGITELMKEQFLLEHSTENRIALGGDDRGFYGNFDFYNSGLTNSMFMFRFLGNSSRNSTFTNALVSDSVKFYINKTYSCSSGKYFKPTHYSLKFKYRSYFYDENDKGTDFAKLFGNTPLNMNFNRLTLDEFFKRFKNKSFLHFTTLTWVERILRFLLREQSNLVYLLFIQFRHKTSLEWFWTFIPAIILASIGVPSLCLLYLSDRPNKRDNFLFTFKCVAHQWYWDYSMATDSRYSLGVNMRDSRVALDDDQNYTASYRFSPKTKGLSKIYHQDSGFIHFDSYMVDEDDIEFGSHRLLEVDNRVVLPSGVMLRGVVTSADVLHSWALPAAIVKIDAVPGRLNQVLFFIKTTGVFYGQCSELCGVNHGFMPIVIEFIPLELFGSLRGHLELPSHLSTGFSS